MTGGVQAVLRKLHGPGRPGLLVGPGGVNPRTARALIRRGYVYTWVTGEFDCWGPYIHISAKSNHDPEARTNRIVRTECSCDACVEAMRCEKCGAAAVEVA